MKTKHEQNFKTLNHQSGNAMIYVLIAIVLFAALSMTLGRQTNTSEASDLSDSKAEMYATQFIAYATQAKASLDQMLFSNTKIDDINFTLPSQAGFNTAPTITKVYHPDGGGLNAGKLPADAIDDNIADPVAGWYMGRFNNVEWTKLGPGNTAGQGGIEASYQDIILVAFQIRKRICEKINMKILGSEAIPKLQNPIRNVMIDDSFYGGAGNADLTTDPTGSPVCAECHNRASLCVEDSAGGTYGFYTVIADR